MITGIFVIFLGITYAFTNRALTGTKKQVINVGNLSLELQEDDNNLTIVDAFPTYDEVGMIGDAFTFRLINKTLQDTNYILKLADITSGEKLFLEDVKCGLTKDGQVTIHLLSDLQDNTVDSGVILGNQTIEYALRLWIKDSVEDDERIAGKSLSFKVEIEQTSGDVENPSPTSTPEPSGEPATDKVFASENLGENCTTYNDGVDTFLVGKCANNYIWYSGKLWRVVLKNNETGAVKMVTDNDITMMNYKSKQISTFENSYVDQWLNQEFLPTLHDYENYLLTNGLWDSAINGSANAPMRPSGEALVERTVGLLNSYEYYTIYEQSNGKATSETNYLNNRTYWWLITQFNSLENYYVSPLGSLLKSGTDTTFASVRPSVYLKSDVSIVSGNGTNSNPYRLKGDKQLTENGVSLVSTRYSGEYIKFNNELYRIVTVEENMTKIIAVDTPSGLESVSFSTSSTNRNFSTASIKGFLEEYYQNLDGSAKSLVQPFTNWYPNTVTQLKGYKDLVCVVVDVNVSIADCEKLNNSVLANIGLPRVGELFCSHISRNGMTNFWTLTPWTYDYVLAITTGITNNFGFFSPVVKNDVHPSMYLKSNVVIASNNTGDGTYEHPYEIELGA